MKYKGRKALITSGPDKGAEGYIVSSCETAVKIRALGMVGDVGWYGYYYVRKDQIELTEEKTMAETLITRGTVVRNLSMQRKYVATRDRALQCNEEIVCDTPHGDGDYSYLCNNQHCRCYQ